MIMELDKYVTIKEAAEILNLSRYMVSAAKRYAGLNPRRRKFPLRKVKEALDDPAFSALDASQPIANAADSRSLG